MKIQTVIFDVGNVLAAFRWKDYLQAFGFSPAFQEELGRILFLDPLWFEWDRGVMTEDEIVEIFCGKHPDYRAEIHRVLDNPYDLVREYPDSADWIREVHGLGRQALLLSNYSRKTFTYAYEHFDSLKLMCKTCFGNPEMICVPETPLLNVSAAAVVTDPLLKRFEEAGEEYAASLRLSPKTVAELERPMISAEDYIRNVNGG